MKHEKKQTNKFSQTRRRSSNRSQIARQILVQYIFTLFSFIILYFLCGILGWSFVSSFTWQPYDPVYQLLAWVRDYILLITIVVFCIAWALITLYFFSRPLRFLDEIVEASARLASPSETPISLPSPLKNIQDELNLAREQALRSAYLAKEAEQRKNDLIVYLAHDLKTPLTSVIGYLSLLMDEPQISQELRTRYAEIALEKAERLEDLINEFFDITRFNLTALTLEPERVSLSRMLEQITNEFYPILNEKGLIWRTKIAPDVQFLCDPDKLQRVFDNLIRNAVNYSYPQTEIFLSLTPYADHIQIIVNNHGKTIPPDKLNRIFEQFFRLDSSRSTMTGGSGLGLAISREIVELHGGSISAESANESVTFTIVLPFLNTFDSHQKIV